MMPDNTTTVDELWEAARRNFPVFSPELQRAGMVLLGELTKGEPVTTSQFAQALGASFATAGALVKNSVLSPFVHLDGEDRIQGFFGLAVTPTHHQLTVSDRTLYAWCAVDCLFLPELIDDTAEIESKDPESGQVVRLTVSPSGVNSVEPAGIVVSMVPPQTWDLTSAARVMKSACHFIFFFTSRASGERWQAKHTEPETILLSMDEAVAYCKRSNAHVFGTELAQRTAGQAGREGRQDEVARAAHSDRGDG
ncbi:organomercurial lyase [Pseudaminobacter sp. NGMCC 1.201702]|uniref:organomercurial lyase n=1 Tax=Pseudaminobacter sp. NGMCC 1.201702 TaxID=3391825 RepID=UPI0039F01ECC